MTKEEKTEIIKKLNTQFDDMEANLNQLLMDDDYWPYIPTACGALDYMRTLIESYEKKLK